MPTPHSSVQYVEPNSSLENISSFSEYLTTDGKVYDKIINPEDYCIGLSITTELCNRGQSIAGGSQAIIVSWENSGKDSKVNFMSGTLISPPVSTKNDSIHNNLNIPYLTTNYADMYVTDLKHYGTTEMIGIKSVNIDFENAVLPVITIQFTDVRGMSLFTPREFSGLDDLAASGGITDKNVAQCFFQCFFKFPYPKFNITVKGFYGRPVTYEVTCDKFETDFNSETGNFDVTVRFIGYKYSFLSDIATELLLTAPYADYLGEKYWNEKKQSGDFAVTNVYGEKVEMPTLVDIRNRIKQILTNGDVGSSDTTLTREDDTHDEERRQLESIKNTYTVWYEQLIKEVNKKYGNDCCFIRTLNSGEYDRLIVLISKDNKANNLSEDAAQFSNEMQKVNNDLAALIDEYNEKFGGINPLDKLSKDYSAYLNTPLFKEVTKNDKNTFEFNGYADNATVPKDIADEMVMNRMGVEGEQDLGSVARHQKTLKTVYGDGSNQKLNCFDINVSYANIQVRIDKLTSDSNKSYAAKKKDKAIHDKNVQLVGSLGFNPTISNFTKIVMAHFETLMHMVYTVSNEIKADSSRTPSTLGLSIGDEGNLSDVKKGHENDVIPPFPRVTEMVTEDDGTQKQQDVWIGSLDKDQLKEADLVETFFNATELIRQLIAEADEKIEDERKDREDQQNGVERGVVRYPLTSYDFFLDSNVYGEDVIENIDKFAGAVSLRMFDILSLNFFANQFGKDNWHKFAEQIGRCEAHNFYKSVNTSNNKEIREWIKLDSGSFNADYVLSAITSSKSGDKYPWSYDTGNQTPRALFSSDNWVLRYDCNTVLGNSYMYPVQNLSFETIQDNYNLFKTPGENLENKDVILSCPSKYLASLDLNDYNAHYNLMICDDYMKIKNMMDLAIAESFSAYTDISQSMSECCSLDKAIEAYYKSIFKDEGITSFCKKSNKSAIVDTVNVKFIDSDAFYVYDKSGNVLTDEDGNKLTYTGSKDDLEEYFTNEISGKHINSCFISEIFDYKEDKTIDYSSSVCNRDFEPTDFLMGIDCIDYAKLHSTLLCKRLSGSNTFNYIPRFVVLQLGAILDSLISTMQDINIGIDSSKLTINVPQGLKDIADDYLNSISVYSRMVLIKYYHDWAANEFPNIKTQLNSANGKKNIAVIAQRRHDYYKKNSTQLVSEFINGRNLLNQNSEFVKTLTDSMMLPVMLVHGNVNHFVNERKPITYTQYKVSNGSVFKNYLNGFIDELNQLLKVDYTVDSNGTMVRRSKIASNTTNEMRIELYRYLKQIYDKWIPSANEDEWNFKNFFDDEGGTGDYKFYFIDSYYNKIGDKLLINPSQLLKTMDVILSYTDINSNLLSLLGTVYGDNRCLFKCIQNFINLADSKAMEDMFKPLSYSTAFSDIRKGSDFVVVYTYEPSKCLDVNSNEYADDGFMLNDEFNTPMSIKTRGAKGKFYRMPAFGVTYGKQYQSFFKRVKVNTKSSIQTEQSIKAKHAILQGLTNKNKNGTQGQDMFDLYTAQSYTCTVEMMGCAWVQPMMYFVLLNVPMFRGSYMIMKVNHSITPGNMTTTFTGCRMSKVGNRFVQDVFINSEGDDTEYIGSDSVTFNNAMANNDNDCPYAVFPVFSDGTSTELKKIVRKWEGEYAGNIDGQICTMRGITLATFRNYYGKDKTCTDLKNISEEQWDNVFKKGFWDKWKADQITNKSIANLLVDWSWGSGCYGFYYPQDVLGTSRSCSAKDADIAAINNYPDKRELFQKLWNRRKQHFEAIARKPGNAQFLKGWLNRLNDFKYFESPTSGNEEELSKMNENVYELFFNAINQTAQNTESMKFGLKNEYYPNKNDSNKIMMVSATDPSNNPKLAKLFDCILNTPDYFRYVNDLYWVYDENVVSNIVRVDVKLSAKDVAANNQHVHFFLKGSKANSAQASKNVFKVEDLSDDLKHSLGKKYKEIGKDKLNTLLGGSISDLDSLAEFGPADCATVGTVSGNIGEWSKAVATMGKWYEKNIHEYNQGSTKYCDLIGTNVRKDCSGFVSACLQLFGTFKKGFMTNSSGFNSDASVASMLTNGGFKKLPYSWETVQPYDIIAYSGHVEILAEKGEHPKSWGWGSAHDCQGVHACMPAGTGKKPIGSTYKTIWRHVG